VEQLFYLPSTMIWPLAACVVLTGILVYLGVHVIARKVIFVDLALAQIAALGTVTGVLLGYEVGKDLTALYLYSLTFTIFGAFIFSATRMKGEKVPHEAIIGIVYAVTFAATILVLSKSALGPQELDHIIKGELLWVQAPTVIKTAIIYASVGIFHFIFRKKFMAISFDAVKADDDGVNVRLWDFLFYMSFGFVITSSVAIAGVFLVFSYLVIPSVGAMLLSDKLGKRLAIGWVAGSIISFIGVKLSYNTGLPTSPLIVVVFAFALMVSGLFRHLALAPAKLIAIRNMLASLAVGALFLGGVFFFRKADEDPLEHAVHLLSSPLSTDRTAALVDLKAFTAQKTEWLQIVVDRLNDEDAEVRKAAVELLSQMKERSVLPKMLALVSDRSDEVRKAAIAAIELVGDRAASDSLLEAVQREDDAEIKLQILTSALKMGNPLSIPQLISMVADGGIFAEDALGLLRAHVGIDPKINNAQQLRRWWKANGNRLHWDGAAKMFTMK